MTNSEKVTFTSEIRQSLLEIKEKRCCKRAMENADSFLFNNALIDESVFECAECKNAFLREVFIKCGFVNSPSKSNHLELKLQNEMNADEMCIFLKEMGLDAKKSHRRNTYLVYFKDGDAIFHFLSLIGAQRYAFDMVNTQIEKTIRNNANRISNCEVANLSKTADAAKKHLDAILALERDGRLEALPEKLLYTATLRRDNPELSLGELASIHEPPITKSCANHRLEKLIKLAFGE